MISRGKQQGFSVAGNPSCLLGFHLCVHFFFPTLFFTFFFFFFLFETEPFEGFDLAADFSNITNYLSSTITTKKKKMMMKALLFQTNEILRYISKCKMTYIDQKCCKLFYNLLVLGYSTAVLTTIAT